MEQNQNYDDQQVIHDNDSYRNIGQFLKQEARKYEQNREFIKSMDERFKGILSIKYRKNNQQQKQIRFLSNTHSIQKTFEQKSDDFQQKNLPINAISKTLDFIQKQKRENEGMVKFLNIPIKLPNNDSKKINVVQKYLKLGQQDQRYFREKQNTQELYNPSKSFRQQLSLVGQFKRNPVTQVNGKNNQQYLINRNKISINGISNLG